VIAITHDRDQLIDQVFDYGQQVLSAELADFCWRITGEEQRRGLDKTAPLRL
jgi:hypothetical protein